MNNAIKYRHFRDFGYNDDYVITQQGFIFATANKTQLQPLNMHQYRVTTKDGKRVYRSIKTLYREAFNKEYAIDNIESLQGENWKPIDNTGKYYISNLGRVKSYQYLNARLLKPYLNNRGYHRVDIITDKRRTYSVHKLVALAFVPNDDPEVKDTVDHIDINKNNNRADNLRWLSRSDNVKEYNKQMLKNTNYDDC